MRKRTGCAAVLVVCAALLLTLAGCASGDYAKAGRLFNAGQYESAAEIYESLRDYKDSPERAKECRYQLALDALAARDYAEAAALLEPLGDFKDSSALLTEARDGCIRAEVRGSFVSRELDMSALACELLGSRLGTDGLGRCFDLGCFSFRLAMSVDDDGTVRISPEESSLAEALAALEAELRSGMNGYLTDLYSDIAESHGLELDELLELSGRDSVEGMLEYETGMSVDVLIAELLESPETEELIARRCGAVGTLKSGGGGLVIVLPDGELRGAYDAESGEIRLQSGDSAQFTPPLPIVFGREP